MTPAEGPINADDRYDLPGLEIEASKRWASDEETPRGLEETDRKAAYLN